MAAAAKTCCQSLVAFCRSFGRPALAGTELEGTHYDRVAGVRRFVVLSPYGQGRSPLPHLKILVVLKRGMEVRSETWAELEAEVAAWIERTEDLAFRNRVLVLSDADEDEDDITTPLTWRLSCRNQNDIRIVSHLQPFSMVRKVPRQRVEFVLVTVIE
jgi:hypothetical protein